MHPYCIYVFDSSTANEAAIAVREGQYDNIIQYHNSKHQHTDDDIIQGVQPMAHMIQQTSHSSHSMLTTLPYNQLTPDHLISQTDQLQPPTRIETSVSSHGPSRSSLTHLYNHDADDQKYEIQETTETSEDRIPNSNGFRNDNRLASKQIVRQDYIDMRSCGNLSQEWLDTICRHMIEHMNSFGICVIDNFLGSIKGEMILTEVKQLFSNRSYTTGKLVSDKLDKTSSDLTVDLERENNAQMKPSSNDPAKTIRNDRVIWVDGDENGCEEINNLIQTLCSVITNSSRLSLYSNTDLDRVVINKRTKAHVACYPGNGTRYIKHVDNPNGDGRVITAIYYLNKNWNIKRDGGLLRMFPTGVDTVANIEPLFDRVLFFWSDRRNPHEVLPAYRDRFAITVWYIGESRTQET